MDSRQNPESGKQNDSRKARMYFILATVFLFVMALFWSVDASLVYLFLGAATFFAFMGFRNVTWKMPQQFSRPQYSPPKKPEPPLADASFDSLLKEILEKKPSGSQASKLPPINPAQKNIGKARLIFWYGLGLIFFFIILSSIFSSVDEPGDEESGDPFQKAEQFYLSGTYDSAANNYKRVIRAEPTRTDAMMGLGNSLFMQSKFDSAILIYDRALSLNPDLDDARYQKGLVYYNQKNYSQAAQALRSLLGKTPNYTGANQLLGDVYYDQKMYDEAFIWYDKAYVNNPHNHWVCYVLGYLYQTKGDASRAISLYKEALSFDSSEVDIYKRLGDLLPGQEGDFYRARAERQ